MHNRIMRGRLTRGRLTVFVLVFGLTAGAAMADGERETGTMNVVASIKPVHSLVSAVMDGVGEPPHLILRGAASPHTFNMRPSDAAAMQRATIIFLVDERKETALAGPIANIGERAEVVRMTGVPGITLVPLREGGAFEMHSHGHDDEEEPHEEYDMHVWLDPVNAGSMAAAIADTLAAHDPDNAAAYHENANDLIERLNDLVGELEVVLAPIRDRPFIVLHDAYRYFEDRFGLAAAGSISVNPERAPGVARVTEIRDRIRELDGACVFAEPQFDRGIVDVVIEGTDARAGIIDPQGAFIDDGPDLYVEMMRAVAASFLECLAPSA